MFLIHVSGWTVVQPKWCWLQCGPDYIRPSPQVDSTVSALMFNRAIFYSNMLYQSFSVLCCLLEPAKFFFLLNSWLVLLVSRPFCGSYILTSLERIYVVRKFEEALWIACIASWCLLALPLPGFHTTHLPAGSKRRHNNVQKFTPAEALASIRWSYIYADANNKLKKLRMDKNNVRFCSRSSWPRTDLGNPAEHNSTRK